MEAFWAGWHLALCSWVWLHKRGSAFSFPQSWFCLAHSSVIETQLSCIWLRPCELFAFPHCCILLLIQITELCYHTFLRFWLSSFLDLAGFVLKFWHLSHFAYSGNTICNLLLGLCIGVFETVLLQPASQKALHRCDCCAHRPVPSAAASSQSSENRGKTCTHM